MSISFYVKNKKKFLGYKAVLNVETALSLLDKELYSYNTGNIDINDLLLSPVSNYQCLLIGDGKESSRGFELSYDTKYNNYVVRIFTPSSREDWLLALEYIKALAKEFDSEILNERGEVYTAGNIDKFDYEYDILYGIKTISSGLKEKGADTFNVYGIYRVVAFNEEMIDEIENSESPVDAFSDIIREIQYLDAFSAHQKFFQKSSGEKIIGSYTLTESVRTILPYKTSIELDNLDFIKNDEIAYWILGLITIDGDKNDESSYNVAGHINYDDFIKKLPKDKYRFIDASYILVEPLSKEEILGFLEISVN